MVMRKYLLAAVLCLGAGALSAPTLSRAAGIDIDIDVAPPVARVEVVPPPRVGFVWDAGHWEWRGNAHVWVAGVWIPERRGWHWVPSHWDHGAHWHFVHGHWAR
jgi:WXXGXW repeat (2 copies)